MKDKLNTAGAKAYIAMATVVGVVVGFAGVSSAEPTPVNPYDGVADGLTEGFDAWAVVTGGVIVGALAMGLGFWGVPQVIQYGKKIFKIGKA